MKNTSREVYALVYAYLSQRDVSLAERYRKLTKAEPLHEKSPTLEKVVEFFLRSSKMAQCLQKDTDWDNISQNGKCCKAQTLQSSLAVSNWHSPKKRMGGSPLPDLHPSVPHTHIPFHIHPTEFSRGSNKYTIGERCNYGTGKTGPDPTWTPRSPRSPVVPPAAEPPSEWSDSDRDHSVDSQRSVDSSVSIRRGGSTPDGLPTAPGDEWVPCDQCGRLWEDGDCLLHGPPITVPDSAVPASTPADQRAARSVPAVLRVGPSGVHRGGLGVWTRRPLPVGLRFGPYRGRPETSRARASAGGCSWEVHRDEQLWFCVDAADPAHANWMRYVNCAPSAEQENVTAYQHRWRIWYRTCRPIPRGTELLVYYGDGYRQELAREAAGKRRRC